MRILMLNYEYPPLGGGAANANFYLLKELETMPDIEIDLVTSSTGSFGIRRLFRNSTGHFLDIGKSDALHKQTNKELLNYSFQAYRYAKKLTKEKEYDFIHAFFGIPCGFLAMYLGLPYIVSLRGSDVPFHNEKFYWLDRLFFARLNKKKIWKKADFVVANSVGLKQEVLLVSPNQQVEIIPNGVDTLSLQPKNAFGNELNIISVSRMSRHKGYHFLFSALEHISGYSCTLVGDGPDLEHYRQAAEDKQLNVELTGRLEKEQVTAKLQAADVFVLPSLNEGMSNAVLEAMACGLPIIMTDVGGASELVQGNGFIVPRSDTDSILKALQVYKHDRRMLEQHAARSRELALTFDWKQTAVSYRNLYEAVLTKSKY